MRHENIIPLTRFLVPIDGSEPSRRAVDLAGCLAAALGHRVEGITLVHVLAGHYLEEHMANVDFRTRHVVESAQFRRLKDAYIEASVRPIMDDAEHILKKRGTVSPVDRVVCDGDPADEIARVAEDGGYSTVIMARRGLSLAREVLIGSVTSKLLHLPSHATTYVTGLRVMSGEMCLAHKILVPLDGSPHALAAAREAAAFASGFGEVVERVVLLRVLDIARYEQRLERGDDPEAEAERILHDGKKILLEAGIDEGLIGASVRSGRPAEVILRTAEETGTTLILMGRKGRSAFSDLFMGSVSTGVLHRAVEQTVGIVCGGEG